jgi:hypothetical protein
MNDLICGEIPERGLAHLLYYGYVGEKRCLGLDLSKLFTNCNEFYLDQVDKTKTKMKITCLPVYELEQLTQSKPSVERYDDLEYKKELFDKISQKRLPSFAQIYFKPFTETKPIDAVDWELLSVGKDALTKKAKHKSETTSNQKSWLSNFDLRELMKRYTILREKVKYLGVFYLQAFDGLKSVESINEAIEMSKVWKITQAHLNDKSTDIIMGHIVMRSHWSALIINKKHKTVFYFCSGGNEPSCFSNSQYMYFYSSQSGFMRSSGKTTSLRYAMIEKFLSMFDKYTIFLNREQAQFLDGECGTFSSLFLILYLLNDVRTKSDIRSLYNFFRFFGDKKVSMLRSLLFVNKRSNEIFQLDKSEWRQISENTKSIVRNILSLVDHDIMSRFL